MPNINAVLNDQIRRLARREINAGTQAVRRGSVHHRHAIAALKKQMAEIITRRALVEGHASRVATLPAEVMEKARFRAMGVKAHRAKLGLSAKQYGRLVGVSELTIYHWESGKARPRNKETTARWLAVRELGKREALDRLGLAQPGPIGIAPKHAALPRKSGRYKQTAEESILSWLKGNKAMSSAQINAAWTKEGRLGNADNTLSRMTKAKKLKRTKLKMQRGSEYRAA